MTSITKTKLSKEKITKFTQQAFGKDVEVKNIIELTDGFFNTAYMIEFKDGQQTVLKVSPRKDIQVMRYEKNLMETEVFVLNKLHKIEGVPVPKVLYYDKSRDIIDNQFFFMEFVEGIPLDKVREELSEEEYNFISSELGGIANKINMVEGDYFGCIAQEDKRFTTWAEAFLSMIKELLADARDVGVSFSYKNDEIYALINQQRDVLNQVKTPSLVHKDLWQGNIFVDPESAEITGIVDCERALFGDRLLEPVCGFLLENKSFMTVHFGKEELSEDEQIRCRLYEVYLYLIMIIESTYREYEDKGMENWARSKLNKILLRLN